MAGGLFKVILLAGARSGLDQLLSDHGDEAFDEALDELLALAEDRLPATAQPLRGAKDNYRIYLYRSLYRAIYRVIMDKQTVVVRRVGPRASVYRGFDRW